MLGLPAWLLIVPVLAFLIFVHELGHFLTAKRFGVRVIEFGFGFPPQMFGVRYGETLYSINWIPMGGFVRMAGEEDPTEVRSFARLSVPKRAVVLVSGSFMNLVVPVVIFTILFMLPHGTLIGGSVIIRAVAPGSPAEQAGLRPGDSFLAVNDHSLSTRPESNERVGELVDRINANLGVPIEVTVRRGGSASGINPSPELSAVETVTVTPRVSPPSLKVVADVADPAGGRGRTLSRGVLTLNDDGSFSYERDANESAGEGVSDGQVSLSRARRYDPGLEIGDTLRQGAIGVSLGIANARVEDTTDPLWVAFPKSFIAIWDVLVETKVGLIDWVSTGSNPGVAGPIGIAQVTGEVVSELGFSRIFLLTALISISLAILNILPIPALDGGRLMFVAIEWVRRGRRISPKKEGLVHLVGFAILIGLIVFISYNDIIRLLNGDSVIR